MSNSKEGARSSGGIAAAVPGTVPGGIAAGLGNTGGMAGGMPGGRSLSQICSHEVVKIHLA